MKRGGFRGKGWVTSYFSSSRDLDLEDFLAKLLGRGTYGGREVNLGGFEGGTWDLLSSGCAPMEGRDGSEMPEEFMRSAFS